MLKRLIAACALLIGGFAFAQIPYPVDVVIGQRWVGTNEAAFYGAARSYIPLSGVELFGVMPYAIPELGFDRDTLEPYARVELNLDSEYATTALFVTRMGDSTRVNVEIRFCVLSPRCSE